MSSVYTINKGMHQPIAFKGLKAQWILYLAVGLVALLLLFAILYLVGVNGLLCLGIIGALGTLLFMQVYRLSHRYGEYGLMKKSARRGIPRVVKNHSRTLFFSVNTKELWKNN